MLKRVASLCAAALVGYSALAYAQSDTVPLSRDVPPTSPLLAIMGREPGVRVIRLSGQPGTDPTVQLRAIAPELLTADPLIVVDGAITAPSLVDFSTLDVERIEVLKGPTASAIYGQVGGNGVVRVYTRRGSDAFRRMEMRLSTEYGRNRVTGRLPLSAHHPFVLNPAGTAYQLDANGNRIFDPDLISDNPYPRTSDAQGSLYPATDFVANQVSASQRFSVARIATSLSDHRDGGGLALVDGFSRRTARLAVDAMPLGGVEIGGTGFVAESSDDTPPWTYLAQSDLTLERDTRYDSLVTSGCPDGVSSCFAPNPSGRSGYVPNPLYTLEVIEAARNRDRRMGQAYATYHPLRWLSLKGSVASDRIGDVQHQTAPVGFVGPLPGGFISSTERLETMRYRDASATITRSIAGTDNVTTLAYMDARYRRDLEADLRPLSSPDPYISAGIFPHDKWKAFILSTAVTRGRLDVSGLVRRDERSRFLLPGKPLLYHRMAAAYRIGSSDAFGGFRDVSVRLSHGTAAVTTWLDVDAFIPLPSGLVFPPPPARQPTYAAESELRLSGVVRENTVEYSYVRKKLRGVPDLRVGPSAYSSFWVNQNRAGGSVHELSISGHRALGGDARLQWNVVADRSRARLEKADVPVLTGLGFLRPGDRIGTIYGVRYVRTAAQLDETIEAGQIAGPVSAYVKNEEGYYVRAADYHTVNERPIQYIRCAQASGGTCTQAVAFFPIANTRPDFTLGFVPSLEWHSLRALATVSWVQGVQAVDEVATRRGFGAPQRDQTSRPAPGSCPDISVDPTCPYSTGRKPVGYYSYFFTFGPNERFVEDASFIKVRDVALDWVVPRQWTRVLHASADTRLGIIGRNVMTITRYSGMDPEFATEFAGGQIVMGRGLTSPYPSYRTITLRAIVGL